MKKLSFLPVIVAGSILAGSVFAEESANNNVVYIKRGNDIVTPTGFERTDVDVPVSVSVITPEEIEASGATSLSDVLRTQTGLQFIDFIGDGSRATINMRGFSATAANNVLIIIDGRKLNNPSQEAPRLSSVSVKDIERIEIIQGSGGVLYGDQAVGGVINIITKKVDSDQFGFSVTHGTDDLSAYRINAQQKITDRLSYRLSAETRLEDNYRDDNESNYDNILFSVNYEPLWGRVRLERGHTDDKINTPGFISNAQIQQNRLQSGFTGRFDHRVNEERAGVDFFLTDHLTLENDFSLRDSNGETANNIQDTRVKRYSTKLLGRWATTNGDILLTSGYEDIKGDYQNTGFSAANWVNHQESIYTQMVYPLSKKISVAAGARYTRVEDVDLRNSLNQDASATARELGLNYKINKTRFFARIAEGFRFANADDNGSTLPSVTFLDPQKSRSYEAGFELNTDKSRLNVLVYDMNVDDEIYFDNTVGQGNFCCNINLDASKRQGVIIEIDGQVHRNILIGGGYNFTKAEYTGGGFQGNEIPGVAEHTALAYLDYSYSENLNFHFDASYTGSQFPQSDNNNASTKLGGYTLLNANVGWKIGDSKIDFRVSNITNKEYGSFFSTGGYPAPERSVEVTYSYNFQ